MPPEGNDTLLATSSPSKRTDDQEIDRAWPKPPLLRTGEGRRRVGIELEFSGLGVEQAARCVVARLGGDLEEISPYEYRIAGTVLGDFKVELDYAYLKELGREGEGNDARFDWRQMSEEALAAVASLVVPVEVVSPPVEFDRLEKLEPLTRRLRREGALGTKHSAVYAFGMHMNPELPSLDSATVTGYLKAYLCLHDWLVRVGEVDWSRRVTPYINPFAKDYVRRVVDRDYWPSLEKLIDDYLEANPDRNRSLDMLPLFAHVDEDRVRAVVDDTRIKPRPTLHYRLPDCDIDREDWSILAAWKHWLQVESLAADERRLELMCRGFCRYLDAPAANMLGDWSSACERWLARI